MGLPGPRRIRGGVRRYRAPAGDAARLPAASHAGDVAGSAHRDAAGAQPPAVRVGLGLARRGTQTAPPIPVPVEREKGSSRKCMGRAYRGVGAPKRRIGPLWPRSLADSAYCGVENPTRWGAGKRRRKAGPGPVESGTRIAAVAPAPRLFGGNRARRTFFSAAGCGTRRHVARPRRGGRLSSCRRAH